MKVLIVLCSVCAMASAVTRRQAYGAPAQISSGGGYSGGSSGGYSGSQSQSQGGYSGGGGASSFSSGGSVGGGYSGGGASSGAFSAGGSNGGSSAGGQVRRYVSIHVAPEEPEDNQARVIRVPGGQDKHVNIIFVKAPSGSSSQNTEVILPEQPEQKTLVYVLVKKAESNSDVKIRAPQPTRPAKPEVFFIRYKNNGGAAAAGGGGDAGGSSYGVPPATGSGPY